MYKLTSPRLVQGPCQTHSVSMNLPTHRLLVAGALSPSLPPQQKTHTHTLCVPTTAAIPSRECAWANSSRAAAQQASEPRWQNRTAGFSHSEHARSSVTHTHTHNRPKAARRMGAIETPMRPLRIYSVLLHTNPLVCPEEQPTAGGSGTGHARLYQCMWCMVCPTSLLHAPTSSKGQLRARRPTAGPAPPDAPPLVGRSRSAWVVGLCVDGWAACRRGLPADKQPAGCGGQSTSGARQRTHKHQATVFWLFIRAESNSYYELKYYAMLCKVAFQTPQQACSADYGAAGKSPAGCWAPHPDLAWPAPARVWDGRSCNRCVAANASFKEHSRRKGCSRMSASEHSDSAKRTRAAWNTCLYGSKVVHPQLHEHTHTHMHTRSNTEGQQLHAPERLHTCSPGTGRCGAAPPPSPSAASKTRPTCVCM